ncbi:MAG: Asp/Glu racemase, partial [Pseudomonadota bacterium]
PVSNSNLEPDMMMLAPAGVSMHFARAGGYDVDQIPDENQMRQYSDSAADEVIDSLRICGSDVIIYGCTSATLAQGPEYDRRFRDNMERVGKAPAVTAASALVKVLKGLGVVNFAFTSPYVQSLNHLAIQYLEDSGLHCVNRIDAPSPMSNEAVARTTPDEIVHIGLQADSDQADALVISCTDYRATEAIIELESTLGKPVITSNQASLLVALEVLGIPADNALMLRQLAPQNYQLLEQD